MDEMAVHEVPTTFTPTPTSPQQPLSPDNCFLVGSALTYVGESVLYALFLAFSGICALGIHSVVVLLRFNSWRGGFVHSNLLLLVHIIC